MQMNTPFNDKEQKYNSQQRLNGNTEKHEDFFDGNRKVTSKNVLLILGGIDIAICSIVIVITLIYFL